MKNKLLFIKILVLLSIFLLSGCKAKESFVQVHESNKQDFSRYKTEKEKTYIIDTLLWRKLFEETVVIIKKKSLFDTSKIETSYAFSLAWLDDEGFLHHEIHNKPYAIVPARIEYRYLTLTDSVDNNQHYNFKNIETKTIEVNKLNWWQKTQIRFFWISLLLLLFAYRKQILKIMKKIIGL